MDVYLQGARDGIEVAERARERQHRNRDHEAVRNDVTAAVGLGDQHAERQQRSDRQSMMQGGARAEAKEDGAGGDGAEHSRQGDQGADAEFAASGMAGAGGGDRGQAHAPDDFEHGYPIDS